MWSRSKSFSLFMLFFVLSKCELINLINFYAVCLYTTWVTLNSIDQYTDSYSYSRLDAIEINFTHHVRTQAPQGCSGNRYARLTRFSLESAHQSNTFRSHIHPKIYIKNLKKYVGSIYRAYVWNSIFNLKKTVDIIF